MTKVKFFCCFERSYTNHGDHIDKNGKAYDSFGFATKKEAVEFGKNSKQEFKIIPAKEVYSWEEKD